MRNFAPSIHRYVLRIWLISSSLTIVRVLYRRWLLIYVDMLGVSALFVVCICVAVGIAHPNLFVRAGASDSQRFLDHFWGIERNDQDTFQWSHGEAGLRLWGFEQGGPVGFRARLSATHEPGRPDVQITLDTNSSHP